MIDSYWIGGCSVVKLVDECSKLIHMLCKAERFGWKSYHPYDQKKVTNIEMVIKELDDLEKRIKEFRVWLKWR